MNNAGKSNVTVFLPPDILAKCRAAAAADGRSLSNFISMKLTSMFMDTRLRDAVMPSMGSARQIDIAEQIARKVKAAPARKK